ncbi:glycoside hydrolase family 13 protein [Botrimarina hoheduenensis]|uniref:Neopullulanase 2 n=1 Tax=Botrimarina hoheduenensis TaxID=2528000 RepID=A0A5C5WDL8_9BACT|nr:glycoside hydrolase family 13 protein [Botrimarina hoheduenensis]TWT48597.1 Neopullulanase 2 [Botrimarina hoheduenensis]
MGRPDKMSEYAKIAGATPCARRLEREYGLVDSGGKERWGKPFGAARSQPASSVLTLAKCLVVRGAGSVAPRMTPVLFLLLVGIFVGLISVGGEARGERTPAAASEGTTDKLTPEQTVPSWAADAIFYQLFPERFRNGDTSNDPTRESLEFPGNVGEDWAITPWTSDWYARADWERARGDHFYDDGVFDRRYGGDLQGVLDKLDYLRDLGINAIYFNPVFYARSLHKYDGNSFHHVDPHFGPDPAGDFAMMANESRDPRTWCWTAADKLFFKVVAEAHARGIRVIIDGVFNHTGRGFFAFEDLLKKQSASEYRDWYVVQAFDNPATHDDEFQYKGWWGVMTLPEFANNAAGDNLHDGPKQYIFDATRRWMDPNGDGDPRDGIDGWRLDVAVEVPIKFWQEWNQLVRASNPEAYTVAEHWEDAAGFLEDGGFSSTMNYYGLAWPVKGYLIDGALSPSDFGRMLTERLRDYPRARQYGLLNLVDSHDTDRVASMIVNASTTRPYLRPDRYDYDVSERVSPRSWEGYQIRKPTVYERRLQRMIGVLQATMVGSPMIYYGTEAGMWGGDDPDDRKPMVWPDLRYDGHAADPMDRETDAARVAFDHQLMRFYQAAFAMRKAHPALRRGEFEIVSTDDAASGLVYRRWDDEETLLIVMNRGDESWTVEIAGDAHSGHGAWSEVFTASGRPDRVKLEQAEGALRVTLPGREAVVLQRASEAPDVAASGRPAVR